MLELYAILGGVGAILAAVIGAFLKGRSSGRDAERRKQDRATIEAHETRDQTDEDTGRLGADVRRERLRRDARD